MNRDSNCRTYGCDYPNTPCELDIEFSGSYDVEDYYYFNGMDRCEAIRRDEI